MVEKVLRGKFREMREIEFTRGKVLIFGVNERKTTPRDIDRFLSLMADRGFECALDRYKRKLEVVCDKR